MMNIIACVISLISAGLSFLQNYDLFRLLNFFRNNPFGLSRNAQILTYAVLLVMVASIVGIVGGIMAMTKKKGAFVCLCLSAVMSTIGFFITPNSSPFGEMQYSYIYAILYAVAAFCAYIGSSSTEEQASSTQSTSTQSTSTFSSTNFSNTVSDIKNLIEKTLKPQQEKSYEPILGVETEALIKHALLFLEDRDFDSAGRYIAQALNQDPENSQAYMIKLMLENNVANYDELVNNLSTPIEDNQLFQRALRFADDDYKKELDNLAQAIRDKLEQERLALEAEQEKRYQEILVLKEKASSREDFEKIVKLAVSIRSYKNANQIYNEFHNKAKQIFINNIPSRFDSFTRMTLLDKYERDLHDLSGIDDISLLSVNSQEENVVIKVSNLIAPQINKKNYEPIPGFETEALIKRAFLFLEDGEFDNAERYLEQALNQDPENARVYFGQLMLNYEAHDVAELINNLSTPIEDEKLFQRALKFADEEYKKELENLAQASRYKLEQARLEQERIQAEKKAEEERIRAEQEAEQKRIQAEREAELERKRAEEEARKEKIYQEILALKEKASPEFSKFNEILKLAALIRSYKDTEKIYGEINQALKIELKYQNVLQEKRNAKSSQDWKNVISHLEALDGYKDTDELLNQAQEALEEVEERERARKKKIIVSAIVAVILAFSAWGINSYIENAKRLAEEQRIEEERIAREKAIMEARIARENVMIAFFEGRYDDITSPDKFSSNPAIVNMLAHVDYERTGANYDTLVRQAEDLREKVPNSYNLDYEEAIKLAGKYPNSNSANKFLGDVYLNGWGAGKDTQKALSYFKVSAEQGDVYSQIALASIYDSLNDKDNASKWYQKLADSGNALAQDKLRAFQEQQKRQEAEKAYIEAQASEASGNLDTALEKYRRAVELGHPEAQKSLTALENKIAQEKAEQERRAQEIQEFQTEYSNGEKYLNDKDYSQAFEIFRRLAVQGYAPAQDKLAWMYQNGWGIEQSYTQAVYWFRKAAEQGNPEALASMGLMYLKGWGVEQNYDTSLEWYSKAASQGSEVAQRRINSIEILKVNKQKIASLNERNGFPLAGKIFAETLSVRQSANAKSRVIKTLRTGHPVSISRAIDNDNDYWFYIKTASGTEGWVLAGYVTIIDRDLTYEEINNRRYSLPKSGYVTTSSSSSFLNLRNIPAIEGSQVVEKLDNRTYFMAYEIFAGDTIDWYRVKPVSSNMEGWVSGKYIELNF